MFSSKSIRSVAIGVVALLCVSSCWAQVPSGLSRPDDLTITLTGVSTLQSPSARAELSIGSLSFYKAHSAPRDRSSAASQVTTRSIAIKVARRDGASGRGVLRAFLVRECDRCKIRLDGIALTTTPSVVPRIVPFNVLTDHLIEIEVPITAPPGALDAEIAWEVQEL